jgi:hypothetical protein
MVFLNTVLGAAALARDFQVDNLAEYDIFSEAEWYFRITMYGCSLTLLGIPNSRWFVLLV